MAKYVPASEPKSCRKYALSIVESLSSADFLAPEGSNGGFLLMHSWRASQPTAMWMCLYTMPTITTSRR